MSPGWHHICPGFDKLVVIRAADDRYFVYCRVGQKRILHLHWGNIYPPHLEQVIGPPAVRVIALLITDIFIAGGYPRSLERVGIFLTQVPVTRGAGRSTHVEITDLALADRVSMLIS